MTTLLLTAAEVKSLISHEMAIGAVEEAYRATAGNDTVMPPKEYLVPPKYHGDLRAMPAYLFGKVGLKWVSVYPENSTRGLPTVMAVFILNDPATGYPLAIMDATVLTDYRTGAAGAVAVKHMASEGAKTVGIVGAGKQAHSILDSILTILRPEEILIWSLEKEISWLESFEGPPIARAPLEKVSACDIVCTVTPTTKPLVRAEWIKEGALIVAAGADAPGKEELEPALLTKAKVVVDDIRQASHAGEINVPVSKERFDPRSIHGTIGEVIAGKKPGREGNEIIIFDSTGIAVQDVSLGAAIYEAAKREGVGREIELV